MGMVEGIEISVSGNKGSEKTELRDSQILGVLFLRVDPAHERNDEKF
jgi:hypothetical protein